MAWYLYGVTAAHGDPSVPHGLIGVDDAPVQMHGDGDLRLIVSSLERTLEELQAADPEETVAAVCRHDAVLTTLVRDIEVLPIRFGTVLPDRSAAADLLADPTGELAAALTAVAGADEWVIRVDAPEPQTLQVAEDLTPGHAFFARKRSQADARGDARRRAERVVAGLGQELAGLVRAVRPLAPREPNTVARIAYLVDRDATHRFLATASAVSDATVETQGPLPPYRFVDPA